MQLRKAAFAGFRFQLYLKVLSVGFHQVGSIILAILLTPNDFGLVGLATVFVGLSAGIADFGIGSAIIQRQSESAEHLDAGATLRLLLSLIVAAVLVLAAPFLAAFYGQPVLRDIVWWLSLLLILNYMGFAARVFLTKSLKFKEVFIPEVAGGVATTLSSILLALVGWSYWSLVAGSLIGALVNVSTLYLVHPWRFSWRFDPPVAMDLLRFGFPLVAGSLLSFAFQNTGVLFLGAVRFSDLGFYLFAYSWAVAIPLSIHVSVDNVMFPVYSAMKQDRDRIRRAYVSSLKHIVRAAVLVGGSLAILAPTFVIALVGSKWSPSIPVIAILGFGGFLYAFSITYHSVAVSLGHPRELLLFNALAVITFAPASILLALYYGASGVAWAFLITSTVLAAWAMYRTERLLGGVARTVGWFFAEPLIAIGCAAIPTLILQSYMEPNLLGLLILVAVAAATYGAALSGLTGGRFIKETREAVHGLIGH